VRGSLRGPSLQPLRAPPSNRHQVIFDIVDDGDEIVLNARRLATQLDGSVIFQAKGKGKERKSIYVAPFCIKVHTKRSGMDHTDERLSWLGWLTYNGWFTT